MARWPAATSAGTWKGCQNVPGAPIGPISRTGSDPEPWTSKAIVIPLTCAAPGMRADALRELVLVVGDRAAHHVARGRGVVDMCDLAERIDAGRVRDLLVGEEVVAQTIDQLGRDLRQLGVAAVGGVVEQHADDLVVGLGAVEQPETADRPGPEQERAVIDRPLGEDA